MENIITSDRYILFDIDPDETAQQRARVEQFSYNIDAPRLIQVTNKSYENPAAHQYTISIDDMIHK
jgi:hypothetical protein